MVQIGVVVLFVKIPEKLVVGRVSCWDYWQSGLDLKREPSLSGELGADLDVPRIKFVNKSHAKWIGKRERDGESGRGPDWTMGAKCRHFALTS